MNNYVSTEKSLKRWLKTRVKVTMATVVGFLIAGTVVMGATTDETEKEKWEKANGTYTNEVLKELATSKFLIGNKEGKLVINTDGSVGKLLSDLQEHHSSLDDIRNALAQNNSTNGKKWVVTGALAGQGKYNTSFMSNLSSIFDKNTTEALKRFQTNTEMKISEIVGDTETTIGNENSPVILGLIGGDFALGTGKVSLPKKEKIGFNRIGNTTVNINNGNVFGAIVGSSAISIGNMCDNKTNGLLIKFQGEAETTIKGNTNLNINKGANAAGVTAGGFATAIGGLAISNINGNSNIVVNSKVDENELAGITAGLFGGGMAVSTLGGRASTEITGTTKVEITDGLSVGVVGGGMAVSTDASQYSNNSLIEKVLVSGAGTDKWVIDFDNLTGTTGKPALNISGVNVGGTSTVKSGDINVALKGKTAAAAVLGNGIAVSHQNSADGTASTSTVEANDITVNIDLDKNLNGAAIGNNGVIGKVKDVFVQLKNIVDPTQETSVKDVIGSMQGAVGALKDGGIVVGLGGNGVAVARDKGVSTVTAKDITMNLKSGYIVGVAGNGIASGNASSTVKADSSTITIDGAEVIGVTGSGIALDHGVADDNGTKEEKGAYSEATIKNTTVNLKSGSADGIFGGGIAVTKDHAYSKAETITSGKSTINVNGGTVDKFGYHHIANIFGTHGSFDKIAEAGKDVAITAGGVASRNGYTKVAESEINITGGIVNGDILAGGIAVAGGISEVGKSTINITGGDIKGNIYGTGIAVAEDKTVGKVDKTKTAATVENSILNINGYKNSLNKISGFNTISIGENTELTITDGIEIANGELTNKGLITLDKEGESTLITLKEGKVTNEGTLAVDSTDKVVKNENGSVVNSGKIKVTDKTVEELEEFSIEDLFEGQYSTTGMLVDKDGKLVLNENDTVIGGDLSTEDINGAENDKGGSVVVGDGATIIGSENEIDRDSLNIGGNVTVKNDGAGNGVTITDTEVNIPTEGKLTVGDADNAADLTIKDGTVNGEEGKTAVDFANKDSSLTLDGTNFTGNIGTEGNTNGTVSVTDSTVDGDITAGSVVTGDEDLWNSLFGSTRLRTALFAATAKEVKTTVYNGDVTASDKLGVINENAIYNGKVTFTGNDGDGINIGATAGNTASARFNGDIKSNNIKLVGDATAYYASNITMTGKDNDTTGTKINGGTNIFEVSGNGENALLNTSNKVGETGTGVSITNNSGVKLEANIDKDTVIDLGDKTNLNQNTVGLTENSDGFYELSKVDGTGNKYALNYKDNIASENGYSAELNDVFAASQVIHSKLNEFGYKTVDERAEVLDKYYSSNIYSETVKAAYDTVKMNEEAVLSLARKSEVGKWTAEGKALYSKDEYDRNGTVGDYSSEIESTGLMAAFGYGLNETTTAGVAFSGVKQDVDTDGGSADADLFYLGLYGNKVVGNYDFTAGLGYQFGEYEADNNILGTTGDKYDSKALSGYVQGRYTADLGDGLSLQPRVRLGYTYVEQDDTRDSYFGVSDTEISTFDAEFGLDTVKSVQLEKSKVDVKFGVSYVRTMGDTDDEFTGRFYGATASEGFDVLGAELAENTVKFNLGAEVTNENGFFYNGGLTYEFGSNDTEAYGVTAGVGYKF